ncbi:MAG: hypothetical protein FWE80_03590 [Oscillospiraceae bacterium]|nr:hypothetical protein [Oscillospiraceae bacterium]
MDIGKKFSQLLNLDFEQLLILGVALLTFGTEDSLPLIAALAYMLLS